MEIQLVIILILLLVILLLCKNLSERFKSDPCSFDITDKEYLKHMIPHHQVAVDISYMLQKQTKWPKMQEVLRKLIWTQEYEIGLMEEMLKKFPENVSDKKDMTRIYKSTISDYLPPNKLGLTRTYCDPHFFDPEAHMKHMSHMKLDDNMYIEHMVPHHQVAVDMSKKLLKNTHNDFMIQLAYRIIRSQQEEVILLKDMLESKNRYYSNMIL